MCDSIVGIRGLHTYAYKQYHTFPILKWALLTNEDGLLQDYRLLAGMPRREIATTVLLCLDALDDGRSKYQCSSCVVEIKNFQIKQQ